MLFQTKVRADRSSQRSELAGSGGDGGVNSGDGGALECLREQAGDAARTVDSTIDALLSGNSPAFLNATAQTGAQ